jgi:tetratricopeptide (TPR) repeat protein
MLNVVSRSNKNYRKTQIVLEAMYRRKTVMPASSAFWVNGSSYNNFSDSYMRIAQRMNIPGWNNEKSDILKLVFDWLQSDESGEWAMVLDDADNSLIYTLDPYNSSQASLISLLPFREGSAILITTRDKMVAQRLNSSIMSIEGLGPSDAMELLSKSMGDPIGDVKERTELVALMDGLPLALTVAAANIGQTGISLPNYLKRLKDTKDLTSSSTGGILPDAFSNVMGNALEQIGHAEPKAFEILSVLSFFNADRIPISLLMNNRSIMPIELSDFGPLTARVFIQKHYDFLFMHRIIQTQIRNMMSDKELLIYGNKALMLLSLNFPEGNFGDWGECATLLPHVQALFEFRFLDDLDQDHLASLFHRSATYLIGRGSYWAAKENISRAHNIRLHVYGLNNSLTLSSLELLGSLLQLLGEYALAEETLSEAISTLRETLRPDNIRLLSFQESLANVYRSQGKNKEAESLYEYILTKQPDQSSLAVVGILQNLGNTYTSQGRYKEAEEMYMRVWEIRKIGLGKDHPDTLTTASSLAMVYYSQGRLEIAATLLGESSTGLEIALGPEHPDVLTNLTNLGMIYTATGKLEQATRILEKTRVTLEKTLGADHPDTLTAIQNLADAKQNQGRYKEAEMLYQIALDSRRKVLGEHHPSTIGAKKNLATLYLNQGDLSQAEESLERVWAELKGVLGREHPLTLSSKVDLGDLYYRKGGSDLSHAEVLLRGALTSAQNSLGRGHDLSLRCMHLLAKVFQREQDYKSAIDFYEELISMQRKRLGENDPHVRTLLAEKSTIEEELRKGTRRKLTSTFHRFRSVLTIISLLQPLTSMTMPSYLIELMM